ncbi:glycosyltransferase [Dyadobacter psychrotolerans]|uniref:Glycosyltransferase n=1 Tax=Dyadobacter psychrotolerans TaxID=2541721 RepID=A0A4R5DVA7_9BACT|nr:glycosyltransferase [Dyadobacter psychrotolerans]TDE16290.1 glycosyltransferase [Dyadobacter psychrotolerans]
MTNTDEIASAPLVTIVLTAYNNERFIEETISSVFKQSYAQIQLIVIDNSSLDSTASVIQNLKEHLPDFIFIKNQVNIGLCKAFNQGLSLAKGKYMIDLSGDDIMLPDRVKKQVAAFEALEKDYGVVFSNAINIDVNGRFLSFHYEVNDVGRAVQLIPGGDVYKNILEKYFICTPTMMMRTSVLLEMGGYDETLSFEDFDFWVRSAVKFKYFYFDEVLMNKRNLPGSLGKKVYQKGSRMLASYYVVCRKAYDLNRDQEEFDLLAARIRTFIRKCFYAQEFELALQFRELLNYIENPGLVTELIVLLCRMRLPVNVIYRFYIENLHKFRNSRKVLAFNSVK